MSHYQKIKDAIRARNFTPEELLEFAAEMYSRARIGQGVRTVLKELDDLEWEANNRRRGELIDKQFSGTLSPSEAYELMRLQAYADEYLDKHAKRDESVLIELEGKLFLT